MIHYCVSFSFKPEARDEDELRKVRDFIEDLCQRAKAHSYRLLRNRNQPPGTRLSRYFVMIVFADNAQFGLPFAEVAATGIHQGRHGFMIENVSDFMVEIFEDVEDHPRS